MRNVVTTLAGFALLAAAMLFSSETARWQHASIHLPPLPVGEQVQISVEPDPPTTGASLAVLSGVLVAVDETWVQLKDEDGRSTWIPRERVVLIRVDRG